MLGGTFGSGISYSANDRAETNSFNENLRVENDDQGLILRSLGMSGMRKDDERKLTPESAAELYWEMLIGRLQGRRSEIPVRQMRGMVMSRFIVRVDLPDLPHGASAQLHRDLHAAQYLRCSRRQQVVVASASRDLLGPGHELGRGDHLARSA